MSEHSSPGLLHPTSPFHALFERVDWCCTALGERLSWPLSLRANVNLMLDTGVAMAIAWGPQRVLLYNAAYAEFLGDRHPWALGQPLQQVWPEVWPDLGPLVERAYAGEALRVDDLALDIRRNGRLERTWFTFHYSPLRDDGGAIGGMCGTMVETTSRVLAEHELRELNRTLEQRVAERTAELERSKAHLLSMFRQTAAGIAETDLSMRIVRANDKYCEIAGRPLDEVLGIRPRDLVHPDDLEANLAALQEMLRTGQPVEIENRYLRADGRWVWVAKMVAPIFEPGAESPSSILAVVVDITQRKEAEAQSQASAERLQLATDAARLGIWTWDAGADKVIWENERIYDIFGIAPGSEPVNVARYIAEFAHPDDVEPYRRAIARSLESGQNYHYEGRFRRASDGALRWLEMTGHLDFDAEGRPRRMLGTAADITERKAVVEQLLTREQRYRTLLSSIDEGFCLVEVIEDADSRAVDHRVLETNPAFERHTGQADAVGKTGSQLAPGVEQHWHELYAKVARSGVPVRAVQHNAALGRWFDVFVAKAEGASDKQVAIVFRDVTAQKRAEDELRQLAADLSQANRRQNEFLATLAHELRNPLAPIRTGLDLMRLNPADAAAVAKVRDMMERQVNHLIHLVNDLLDLARIQSGKVELKRARVLLQDIAADAVEASMPLVRSRRHALAVDAPEAPMWVDADPIRLVQVLANLLTNAAKYTPEGGRIGLALRRDGADAVAEVSDNGIGIPAEAIGGLFEMFSQGRHGSSYAQGGLGIGLCLVKRLAEQHGGTVAASSPGPGLGSRFTLRLPLAPDAQARAQALPAADQPAAGAPAARPAPLRILIADDNQDAADLLAQSLQLEGHAVTTVHDGRAALDAIAAGRPNLALLDIGMPGMDGYQLAEAIRRDPGLRRTVLAALTGWGASEDRARSRRAGFDHHLTKPVDLDSILAIAAAIRPASSDPS